MAYLPSLKKKFKDKNLFILRQKKRMFGSFGFIVLFQICLVMKCIFYVSAIITSFSWTFPKIG